MLFTQHRKVPQLTLSLAGTSITFVSVPGGVPGSKYDLGLTSVCNSTVLNEISGSSGGLLKIQPCTTLNWPRIMPHLMNSVAPISYK